MNLSDFRHSAATSFVDSGNDKSMNEDKLKLLSNFSLSIDLLLFIMEDDGSKSCKVLVLVKACKLLALGADVFCSRSIREEPESSGVSLSSGSPLFTTVTAIVVGVVLGLRDIP